MYFKAAIFDLDGTILNTIVDLMNAMNHMLRDFGFPEKDLEHHTNAVGSGVSNYVQLCLPEDKRDDADLVAKCVKSMRTYYNESYTLNTKPYDGIKELMQFFAVNGIKLNVLSNKVDPATKSMVQIFFSEFDFSYVYGERENIPRKPDPTVALEIADGLGINPSKILFIGDSRYDMMTAKDAGMYGVGVLWGYQSKDMLVRNGAKITVSTTRELIDFVKNYSEEEV